VLPLGYRFSQALEMQTVWDGALALPKANTMIGYTHTNIDTYKWSKCVFERKYSFHLIIGDVAKASITIAFTQTCT